MVATSTVTRRRSPRLASSLADDNHSPPPEAKKPTVIKTDKNIITKPKKATAKKVATSNAKASEKLEKSKVAQEPRCLERTRELHLLENDPKLQWIIGVDEAGRGPLAGPVVAAAAIVPTNIPGITDSKKLTCEDMREQLYEKITSSPNVSWAVAIVDAQRIDEVNILQATMQAMSMAANALVSRDQKAWIQAAKRPACTSLEGCYVSCGGKIPTLASTDTKSKKNNNSNGSKDSENTSFYALIDGNRMPQDLICGGESIVKGDSREYSIAAASILAKVTRDRLMHSYDKLYPEYNLAQHKGYPTKAHMAAVMQFGASPIHRRTFAPLKHMDFDEDGKVVPCN